MKLSKRSSKAIGCLWLSSSSLLLVLQVIFLTLKLSGTVSWSWWTTLAPIFCVLFLPIAIMLIAVLVLLPKAVGDNIKRRKRVEAEAKNYGLVRKPGESDGELMKRIVRRNMIAGNYSRKDIKDAILEAFPDVGSCQIFVNCQGDEIVMRLRGVKAEIGTPYFSDDELQEVAKFAEAYIPSRYKITVKNAEVQKKWRLTTSESFVLKRRSAASARTSTSAKPTGAAI